MPQNTGSHCSPKLCYVKVFRVGVILVHKTGCRVSRNESSSRQEIKEWHTVILDATQPPGGDEPEKNVVFVVECSFLSIPAPILKMTSL